MMNKAAQDAFRWTRRAAFVRTIVCVIACLCRI